MAVNGRTRQRGAMTALIWKCQGMDVYVPEIVQTFGVQTLEKVNLTVAIERRVRGRVDFKTSPLEISIQISMIGNLLTTCVKIAPPSGGPALLNAAAVKLTLVF